MFGAVSPRMVRLARVKFISQNYRTVSVSVDVLVLPEASSAVSVYVVVFAGVTSKQRV